LSIKKTKSILISKLILVVLNSLKFSIGVNYFPTFLFLIFEELMMAIAQLKDGRWICYYRIEGEDGKKSRIKKEYFGRGAEAEAAANQRNNELSLQKRQPTRAQMGPAFAELAESYVKNKDFNQNSKKHLKIRLQSNLLPFFGAMPAIRIRDQDVDNYAQKRRRDPVRNQKGKVIRIGVKDATIARELTDLKAILSWSVQRHPPLIAFNPIAHYKKPREDNAVIPPPTQEETHQILKFAKPHLVRVVKLAYYTGLRPGAVELLCLTWDGINWESKTILIRSAHKGGPTKRLVPVHEDFLKELKEWHKEDNKGKKKSRQNHIIHYRGKPIKSFKKSWQTALKDAGIKRRIRPYDFRHFFVTKALEEGADYKALADIVGSRPETLMRHYQHVTKKLHRQTVAKIPALEN
jgi:integrase